MLRAALAAALLVCTLAQTCPWANLGCLPDSGVTPFYFVNDTTGPNPINDEFDGYCSGEYCQAGFYGGMYGEGDTFPGGNQWGAPFTWNATFVLPNFVAGTPLVTGELTLNASVDSGYTYPSPLPYSINIYINGQLALANTPLTTLIRNSAYLGNPQPQDKNMRLWTVQLPPSALALITTGTPTISYQLLSTGWMVIEASTLLVTTCATGCQCYCLPQNGFWQGNWCDQCLDGYSGDICNVGPPTIELVEGPTQYVPTPESHKGLNAALVFFVLLAIFSLLLNFVLFRKYRQANEQRDPLLRK